MAAYTSIGPFNPIDPRYIPVYTVQHLHQLYYYVIFNDFNLSCQMMMLLLKRWKNGFVGNVCRDSTGSNIFVKYGDAIAHINKTKKNGKESKYWLLLVEPRLWTKIMDATGIQPAS